MFDLIIIGAGPAGLTAAIYALRYSLKTLVLGSVPGGRVMETVKIENWPGEKSISGAELGKKMLEQAKGLGVDFRARKVKSLKLKVKSGGEIFEVTCESGEKFTGRAVLIATGTVHRKLEVPGEKELIGRGVSYCATCDAAFFKDKVVAVVGGGDAGVLGALNLADVAKHVYLIHRRSEFKAKPDFVRNVRHGGKIELVLEREVREILAKSDGRLLKVSCPPIPPPWRWDLQTPPRCFLGGQSGDVVGGVILNKEYKGHRVLKVDGIFIEIGSEPNRTFSKQLGLETDAQGYIKTGANQSTNVLGVFAAGDITTGSNGMRQIVTAAAEGAVAAEGVYKFIKRLRD